MKLEQAVLDELMVHPGEPAGLNRRSTESTTAEWKGASKKHYKKMAKEDLRSFVAELVEAQRRFWANDSHALLVVLQAMDAAGKDGTIRLNRPGPRGDLSAWKGWCHASEPGIPEEVPA
jgi:polyphosphate kinase 2 (PPK2 family)